ncbi:MAG: hypothetical protein ABI678_21340 [Kofleriaceae bacterium]
MLVPLLVIAPQPGCGVQASQDESIGTSALSVPIGAPPFKDGVYVPITDLPVASTNGAVVKLNGNAALSSIGTTFGEVTAESDGTLTKFSADIRLHTALTLDVSVSVSGDFKSKIDLPPVPLPPLQIAPNVIVTPVAFLTFAIEGTAGGVVHTSVVMPFETGVSFALQDGKPVLQLDETPAFKPLAGGPDVASAVNVDVQASALVGVAFLTTVDGFPIGGPSVQSKLGVEVSVSTAAAHWWKAYAGATLQAGWSLDGSGSVSHVVDLVGPARWLLAQAPGTLPLAGESTRWSRVYQSASAPVVAVVSHGDDLFIEAARFGTPYTAELDGQGLPIWESSADPILDGADAPTGMVRASNGELTVAATVSGAAMRVDRYDALGTPLWARIMNRPSTSALVGGWTAITDTADDGVVVAGTLTDLGKTSLLFARLDSAGNTVWITQVDPGVGATNPTIAGLAREASGNILAVGNVVYGDKPNDPTATIDRSNALVVRLDSSGNLLAARAVGGIGGELGMRVLANADGSYVIGGEVPTLGLGAQAHGAWLATFAADDTLTSSMIYAGEDEDLGEGNVTGVAAAPGGGYLVSGNLGYQHDAWIMRVDGAGMPVWFKSLRGAATDFLEGITALDDGLVAFGFTSSVSTAIPAANDSWLVRTNVDGMVDFTGTGGLTAVIDIVGWESTIDFVSVSLAATATTPALSTAAAVLTPTPVTSTVQLLTR